MAQPVTVQRISAVTLTTDDMARAVDFYGRLGFGIAYGGDTADFTSLVAGSSYLNLRLREPSVPATDWGRVIFYVSNVDAFFERAVAAGLSPEFAPKDAPWGERYFHINSPDGHPLSFAAPLSAEKLGGGRSR